MAGPRQLRLLLWKDYLIRKRKLITLFGVIWATAVVSSLYIVRINVDNQDFPTCQFPARALPSAGMLTFMQSFMCSVENQCSPMDQFIEIPTYENSTLTQLQRKLSPILNDTVLDVAATVPDALKLVATLADVVDVPAFVDISKNGLKVGDLFAKPVKKVILILSKKLDLSDEEVGSIMNGDIGFQGLLKGKLNRCSVESLSKTILMSNVHHLEILVEKLCSLSDEELQNIMMELLFEVDYSKYMNMLGEMYFKLSGDNRIMKLGDMLTAVLRMTKLSSFLPPELVSIFQGQAVDFSYVHLSLIPKLMDLFEPTFGDTESYKSGRGLLNTVVVGIQYLDKIVSKQGTHDVSGDATSLAPNNVGNKRQANGLQAISNMIHNTADVFEEVMETDSTLDAYNVLAQLMKFIYKFLPDTTKHDVLFYSTLLSKLLESAHSVIAINMNIEQLAYNVTLRHPQAVKVLVSLPPTVLGKGFEALTNAERTQILTSKVNIPSQMLCDVYKLQTFFVISKAEAESLKHQICTDAFKNYVSDLISSFGVFDAKNNINNMTSLLIQETLGKDTTDQLYSIEQDFQVLKNFTNALIRLDAEPKLDINWSQLLNISEDSEFMKVGRNKGHLGKQMLIVIHGALAKEIVQQNPILDYKISPYLADVTSLVSAMNQQLALTPEYVTDGLKTLYPDIVRTVLMTAMQEGKTYKVLSTAATDMFCNSVENAGLYLELLKPDDKLVAALCNATIAIENGLKNNSYVSKAIRDIMNSSHTSLSVDWIKLINNLKDLYVKLEKDYPYLFQFKHYGMSGEMRKELDGMFNEAKEYWFGVKNMERSLHLSVKLLLKFLDILDSGLFDMSGEKWPKIKYYLSSIIGPISVFDQSVKLLAGLVMKQSHNSDLPPSTVAALSLVIPNLPQLIIDAVDIVVHDNTDMEPIIALMNADPPWPCATTSISELLELSNSSKQAVRGLETIFCIDEDLQEEWVKYLAAKNATVYKSTKWNETVFEPHIFLKSSAMFDDLVQDMFLARQAFQFVMNHSSTEDHVGLVSAWQYAVNALNTSDRNVLLRKVFNKVDWVLNAVHTSSMSDVSVNALWEQVAQCRYSEASCRLLARAAWKHTFQTLAVVLESVATDLLTYFTEVEEPNSNLLQALGFTRQTGLYSLYDKLPEFLGVLLNSYWDYGFMSQVRRASLSPFWDCDALVMALVPPPGSVIDGAFIDKVRPLLCPSLLHWLSMPRGENTLIDVVAKPQYYFYSLHVKNLTSNFEKAFIKATELADYLTVISKKNQTILTKADIKMNSIEGKLQTAVDTVLNYRINATDPYYRLFSEINKKQFISSIYLTRIVAMVNKLSEEINKLNISAINNITDGDTTKLDDEITVIRNIFKRRPLDALKLHFDVLTDAVWNYNENYTLVNALNTMCNDLKTDVSKMLLDNEARGKKQICAKNYETIYSAIQNVIDDDYEDARKSLLNLVDTLRSDEETVSDVFEFLNKRKKIMAALKASVKHAYDLSLPIYLKYLQSNLQSYNVVLDFLSGGDWWQELKDLYKGPHAVKFFGYLENSFEVAEGLLTNFDDFHLIRLLHDIDMNQTDAFCQPNITLSDYLPDSTGMLSELKRQVCSTEKAELFRELPPLLFPSQGLEPSLKLSKTINYTAVNEDISKVEARLELLRDGPNSPQRPSWVTEEKMAHLRVVTMKLLSKETITKFAFAVLSNGVDAGTLFLNNSQCAVCSKLTSWFKQLNLQLFKKQEYDSLLCSMHSMSLADIHHTLKNDFHWDMMIKELISTRNYTKYELNKSMNQFLDQMKLHLLEDISVSSVKLAECLAHNASRNELGNATLLASVLAHTARLLRAELPHIHDVDEIRDIRYLQQLATEVAHNLDVEVPLKAYLLKNNDLRQQLMDIVADENFVYDILEANVNLRKIHSAPHLIEQYVLLADTDWISTCSKHNCSAIAASINSNVNRTHVETTLPKLQKEEFWRFSFVSDIIAHVEELLSHGARLLGVASQVDVSGVSEGRLTAIIDALMLLMTDEVVDTLIFSIEGLSSELHPLLHGMPLQFDLRALSSGLDILHQFKNYLLHNVDLKLELAPLFPDGAGVESALSSRGLNATNFWSVAAPRLRSGHLLLQPILSTRPEDSHISRFLCQMDALGRVLQPSEYGAVTAEDVSAAVIEQFCGLDDRTAKQILPVLLAHFNFTVVLDKVANVLLSKLYSASNLSLSEGTAVVAQYGEMAALLPLLNTAIDEDVRHTLAHEPLFNTLKDFSSVSNLMSSPQFLSSAGHMLCGKPFELNINRMYKSIASAPDFNAEPDQAQLDVLPTDFCRSLYKGVLGMEGGKIVWSFAKPLLMGRILYTPPTPAVAAIVRQANSTFSTMIKMTNLVHSFAKSFPAVGKLTSHRAGVEVLQRMMTSPQFRDIRTMITGDDTDNDTDVPDFDLDAILKEFGDLDSIGSLLSKASDLLHCIKLDRFQAASDEQELMHEAARLSVVNEFTAGLVFLNDSGDSLTNVQYKIRMDIDNAPTTKRLKDYLWIPGPEANFVENMRYFRGFIQLQDIVDKAIIQLASHNGRGKRELPQAANGWAVYTQETPYPCYRKDFFQTSIYESQVLLVTFFFSLLFSVASAVRFIVFDKESGNTMLMSVMGVDLRWHSLSWFIASLAEMTVTVAAVTVVLHVGQVLPKTDPSLVFALLFIFGLAVLSFCYMLSKLFNSASLAAVCAAMTYLISFMPFVIILSLEAVLVSSLKMFVCLSMSSSLCYAFLLISRYEARGAGAGWPQLWETADFSEDMSIGLAAAMMLLDAGIYFAIGWIVDRYCGIKTLESNIIQCTTSNEKAGVSIVNVSKSYGRKLALDNVSMELHKGQVTALLGHNGAGKTTLINILTGMLRPSQGHVIVRSERGGPRLGVCPQRDVLIPQLSAAEHVALYAQLKAGLAREEVRDEVDKTLQVLSLGPVCGEPVWRLSGGTRRRLCVALAFVGRPHLVSLDEPTAGVDPAARRDIWSMIVKLKEDRTILLTTHHLDEAELLSDQIIIMHKGQIHTSGSPIEIKRTLGNGYKLTVMYPEKTEDQITDSWTEDVGLEEKTKQLLAMVRDVIKNANLVDINGLEVEISLPFFDANGLNNNFHQLCAVLEATQSALGFSSYTLDCSSLEQVFFNICRQADAPQNGIEYVAESPSKSASSSSIRTEQSGPALLPPEGPLRGCRWQHFGALLRARLTHHVRNRWLLFMLFVLPTLFIVVAMAFSMLRPPADNEISLQLHEALYGGSTEFLVPRPSTYTDKLDQSFAEKVLEHLQMGKQLRNWTRQDSPTCHCVVTHQQCNITTNQTTNLPEMMALPDVDALNNWIIDTHDIYIEKRYGGFTSALKDNITNLVAWYNNKGHHALPVYLNAVNNAILRTVTGNNAANITTYTHPLKISKEQLSKSTVYQHVADAGISGLVLLGFALVSAGAALGLVAPRVSQQKRLQLLCGVSPAGYWTAALVWDMLVIALNVCITAAVMLAFGFPVFVARNNLPAICLLFLAYGFACGSLIHVAEKLFADASIANMVLFCGNAFVGLSCLAILLILDIISESEATDYARYVLHKIFMLAPQFALGDGLLEIAKNTIQAQVLSRFGMDTYKDPLGSELVLYHYIYLMAVGTALFLLNLAIEYDCFEVILSRFRNEYIPARSSGEPEPAEVVEERRRVMAARVQHEPLRVNTIGNINRGFNLMEGKDSIQRVAVGGDAAQCVALSKRFPALRGSRIALRGLTLGIPPGQCTALLGQNGAGKSTTFSLLTGELRPSAGQIYLNNRPVSPRQLATGLISYCPQSDAIDPLLTVQETLAFYCRLRGIDDQHEVVKRTMALFELRQHAASPSGTLSGGNRRKLCTAIAFMARTPLVLLDEPTSGMDPMSRRCVARGVRAACAARRGVLLATHALDDARRLAARVALLSQGELVALAPLERCLSRFGGGYVVQCRVCRGGAEAAWAWVRSRCRAAQLRVLHQHALHFLVPLVTIVDNKEVSTRLSEIFSLMTELQSTCDIEDYTVNQSSLEQMFLSFTDKDKIDSEPPQLEPLPTHDELESVTSL